MWLMWLVIVLALAMMIGPIMMLQPSPGTRRAAQMRTAASQMGMTVRLENIKTGNKSISRAVYCLPLRKQDKDEEDQANCYWVLEKKSYTHEMHFFQQWDWRGTGRAPRHQHATLLAIVTELPDDFFALSYTAAGLACEWNENARGLNEKAAVKKVYDTLCQIAVRLDMMQESKVSVNKP